MISLNPEAKYGLDEKASPQVGRRWRLVAALFTAAIALRLLVAFALPNIHHPDEIFQALEQAHRAAFGFGLVPWEFRDGARSWLLPGMLVGPMLFGEAIDPGGVAYRTLPQVLIVLLSSSVVILAYRWATRIGQLHAILAAALLCVWFELVYFGGKTLSEVVATTFLFAAVYLCSERDEFRGVRAAMVTGACLGLAFVFRFHLAPALAIAACWYARAEVRGRWLPLAVGATPPLILLAFADWHAWSTPFESVLNNFVANIIDGRSHRYGTSPPLWYLWEVGRRWNIAVVPILLLAIYGARRRALPLLVATLIVFSHSLIAHKEYRFIYPALVLVLFSAAIGTGEFIAKRTTDSGQTSRHVALVLGCALWITTSLALAFSDAMRPDWLRGRAGLELVSRAGRDGSCGIAILESWAWTGGYSSLHRDVPIHLPRRSGPTRLNTKAFDMLIAPSTWVPPMQLGFKKVQCSTQLTYSGEDLCLWRRAGACERNPETEAQLIMEAAGQ